MTNNSNQPKHTQGELIRLDKEAHGDKKIIEFLYHITIGEKNKGVAYVALGRTVDEAEANAQRIVKAVNMHDAIIDKLKLSKRFIVGLVESSKMKSDVKAMWQGEIEGIDRLLKQAEGK